MDGGASGANITGRVRWTARAVIVASRRKVGRAWRSGAGSCGGKLERESFRAHLEALVGEPARHVAPHAPHATNARAGTPTPSPLPARLWRASAAPEQTPGARYLEQRGVWPAGERFPASVRWLPCKEMSKQDRIRACYLHACLRYVTQKTMTNTSVRERFGIGERNAAGASRLLGEAVEAGLIVVADPAAGTRSRTYLPFWVKPPS